MVMKSTSFQPPQGQETECSPAPRNLPIVCLQEVTTALMLYDQKTTVIMIKEKSVEKFKTRTEMCQRGDWNLG